MDDDAWFRPKRLGIGAGLPIRWQGWALTAAYVVSLMLLAHWASTDPLALVVGIAGFTALFMIAVARKTKGGWRWRWGNKR